MRLALIALLIVSWLSACTVLPEAESVDVYRLHPATTIVTDSSQEFPSALRVSRPLVTDLLAGNRVLRLHADQSFAAYSATRWSSAIPVLWRDWLTDALSQNSGFSQVSSDIDNVAADLELTGTLRNFHIETHDGRSYAVVQFDARLIKLTGRSVSAQQRFDARVAVTDNSSGAAVAALSQATQAVYTDLVAWLFTQESR